MLIGCGKDFPSMDAEERQLCQIFVIEPDSLMREEMGRCLRELGFSKLSDVATHAEGIEKVVHDNYTM